MPEALAWFFHDSITAQVHKTDTPVVMGLVNFVYLLYDLNQIVSWWSMFFSIESSEYDKPSSLGKTYWKLKSIDLRCRLITKIDVEHFGRQCGSKWTPASASGHHNSTSRETLKRHDFPSRPHLNFIRSSRWTWTCKIFLADPLRISDFQNILWTAWHSRKTPSILVLSHNNFGSSWRRICSQEQPRTLFSTHGDLERNESNHLSLVGLIWTSIPQHAGCSASHQAVQMPERLKVYFFVLSPTLVSVVYMHTPL